MMCKNQTTVQGLLRHILSIKNVAKMLQRLLEKDNSYEEVDPKVAHDDCRLPTVLLTPIVRTAVESWTRRGFYTPQVMRSKGQSLRNPWHPLRK